MQIGVATRISFDQRADVNSLSLFHASLKRKKNEKTVKERRAML